MNKILLKELLSTIRINIKRFISLVLIIFLGVAFYVGMKSNAPVLKKTMNEYFYEYNYMDIQIIPPIGITENEIKTLKKSVKDIENIEGGFQESVDVDLQNDKIKEIQKSTILVNSYNEKNKINKVMIVEGKEVSSINEIMIDTSMEQLGYKIGDKITIEHEKIKNKEFTIVGTIRSPEHISIDKRMSKLNNGELNYFVYILEENFDYDGIYNRSYIQVKTDKQSFTTEYDDYIDKVVQKIEEISPEISKKRKEEFIETTRVELQEKEEEFKQNKEKALKELKNAKNTIDKSEKKLSEAKEELMTDKEIDIFLENSKFQLDSAKQDLDNAKTALDTAEEMLAEAEKSEASDIEYWENKKQEAEEELRTTEERIAEVEEEISIVSENCLKLEMDKGGQCIERLTELNGELALLKQNVIILSNEIKQMEDMLEYIDSKEINTESAEQYLDERQKEYDEALEEYNKSLEKYNYANKNLKKEMASARTEVKEKEEELAKAKEEYKKQEDEVNKKLFDAETELSKAKNQLNTLETITWYVFDRNYQNNYSQYRDDVMRVENISKILPYVFFLVVALVTSSSISRLVQEERGKIGILKSLGYTNNKVLLKYMCYTGLAVFIGIILGLTFGIVGFPNIFATVYSLLYYIPPLKYTIEINHIFISIIATLLSSILVAYTVVRTTLVEQPYYLLRPKLEAKARKTLLEKNTKIWKKMSFMKKVTYRNIFRSVRKSLMTILGIAGCTALIIAGFGTREAFGNIIFDQYDKLFKLNSELFLKEDLTKNEIEEEQKRVTELPGVELATMGMIKIVNFKVPSDKKIQVNLVVPNDEKSFYQVINLKKINSDSNLKLSDEGVVLTQKIAILLNARVGDKVTFTEDNNSYTVKVIGICENYVYHYMYMTKNYYQETFNIEPQSNLLLAKYKENEDEITVTEEISSSGKYSNILSMSDAEEMHNIIMERFNIVLIVIILFAALLAFVVLYNISKINISERTKEIATLKVLGFNLKEVNGYINREINILTGIGIVLGIFFGNVLTTSIIKTCEIDSLMFSREISIIAYIYGIVLTIIFTFVINKLIGKDIISINMVESLKNVE